jgi:ADP-dependent NAD(P)H-hydrate dehydratase
LSSLELVTQLPVLPPRPADSNKGNFGRVLVVAGSRGMSGAAILCASAALRGGAGLVKAAVPEGILPIVAAANPCYLTAPLTQDEHGQLADRAQAEILDLGEANDILALGPGLGRSSAITALLSVVLDQVKIPTVLDADGLNALQHQTEHLKGHAAPLILTPHPGEFARLVDSDVPTVQSRRQELAVRFAADHEVILVLKGAGTIVTDGRRVYRNTTGNPGMATGGTGDVLTGLIAALLGQKFEPFAAAQLGVHLHGLAGDMARDELGEVSLIASDLLDYLPRALRNF